MTLNAPPSPPPAKPLTGTQWLICIIASIGFAFDIYELLMLPLVARPALEELTGFKAGTPEFTKMFKIWFPLMFYVPAFFGGIFGLMGGYLTDRLGRRQVLTWSILLYAFSAFAAGFAPNLYWLLFFRTTTFVGVCIEFVAAVAWLAELFDNPKQREQVLGYTQAFSSIGGLLVAIVFGILTKGHLSERLWAVSIPGFLGTITDPHAPWRYTLMSGILPALPLIFIRPFLPESPAWAAKKAAGTLRRPSIAELFSPQLRRTTIVTMLMFACSYGAAFGALQHLPQLVRGLADVKASVAGKPIPEARRIEQNVGAEYTKMQEIGGLTGRFLLAILATIIVSRQWLLRVFQIPGLILMPAIFYLFLTVENRHFFTIPLNSLYLGELPVTTMSIGAFIAGLFTVAQFSFWGNYLPRVYPVHLRGTGESFAANIGGRLIGTSFAAVTSGLAGEVPEKLTLVTASVAFGVFFVGLILSFFLPEPGPEEHE